MKRLLLAAVLMLFALGSVAQEKTTREYDVQKYLSLFNQVYLTLEETYVDSLHTRETIENALAYMLANLDPYTEYYAKENTAEMRQMTSGKYAGIGALIQYRPSLKRCIISEPYANTPAAEAGLQTGDVIMAIDGEDLGENADDASATYSNSVSSRLRGEPGTQFRLTVKRNNVAAPLQFDITRRTITMPTVVLDTLLRDSVAYISLNQYNEQTYHDVRLALTQLKKQGATRLLLDLRGNVGGLLSEAVKVVSLFVPRGKEVVRVKEKADKEGRAYNTETSPVDTTIPIVVLVDGGTASAAEITCGALQDYDRAVVVGRNTYGKGLVQSAYPLEYDALLKVTTGKYYIPSGRCVQAYSYENGMPKHLPDSIAEAFHTAAGRTVYAGGGVKPDIEVKADSLPLLINYLEASDAMLDFCTDYQQSHPTIAPAAEFSLSAEEYSALCQYLKDHNFTYDTQSQTGLKALRAIAKFEGYSEMAADAFDALEEKLCKNNDFDFQKWEPEIRNTIETHLIGRYYYQRGKEAYSLRADKDLSVALDILCNDTRYHEILSPKAN